MFLHYESIEIFEIDIMFLIIFHFRSLLLNIINNISIDNICNSDNHKCTRCFMLQEHLPRYSQHGHSDHEDYGEF